ncbi:amino acid ABC transporter substrate-binding protein, partial [Burkholderia gladioli]|nr:amino acid ABC transporter substrate-binding protein [Burkholderia gladioli]
MKKTLLAATLAALTGFAALAPSLAHADRLDDIKQAGVLRVATFDS